MSTNTFHSSKYIIIHIFFILITFSEAKAEVKGDIVNYQNKLNIQQSELNNVEKEINKYKSSIFTLSKKEKSLNKKLSDIKKDIKYQQLKLKSLKAEISKVRKKEDKLQNKLRKAEKASKKNAGLLMETLKYYYFRQGRRNSLPWFASLLSDVDNIEYIENKFVAVPANKCYEIREEIEKITSLKIALEDQQRSLVKLREDFINAQNSFIGKKKKQLFLLKKIQEKKKKETKQLKEMQENRKKLSTLIVSLKREVKNMKRLQMIAKDFTSAKGKLPWPIKGKVITHFGRKKHSKLDTYIYNRGINIELASGKSDEVKAIAGGEVVYADKFEGMSNMVVIDHGNQYYTIYGNLKELFVSVGSEVEIQRNLGKPEANVVYFEIGRAAKPQDPMKWLKTKN